jgi:hypothetical protein
VIYTFLATASKIGGIGADALTEIVKVLADSVQTAVPHQLVTATTS